MINVNKIIENRIIIRENKKKRSLFEYEIRRIDKENKEMVDNCGHNLILYYGPNESQRFECFGCGVKTSIYEHLMCKDEEYIEKMKELGKVVIDVSKYLGKVRREALFRLIETELANISTKQNIDYDSLIEEIDKKVKQLIK